MAEPLRLDWTDEALANLEALLRHMPAASIRAEKDIRRMARSGFNYGRRVLSEPGVWYWPADIVGVYYAATGTTIVVTRLVDARRLKTLP